jgi:LuxR family transcriptional regulator of csgAB operon
MIEAGVVLIGRQNCQNLLLAKSIHDETKCPCEVVGARDLFALSIRPGTLAIADVEELPASAVAASLEQLAISLPASPIAVLNVDEQLALEPIIASRGVRGVFARGTAPESLLKGVAALLKGDYWLPRRALSDHLEQTRSGYLGHRAPCEEGLLTRKEAEIITLLVSGSSNGDIASRLNVSPHTVKTHVYNLFRKIGVNNRAQAVAWCLQSRLPGQ